jgi:antitoxin HicB
MVGETTATPSEQVSSYLRRPYARIIVPEKDGTFRGEILEFPGCIATGDTPAETLSELDEVASAWLEGALEHNQPIPDPVENTEFSGRLVLRLPKSLHKKAVRAAERDGVSLNQFIVMSLAEHVGERARPQNQITFSTVLSTVGVGFVVYERASGSGQATDLGAVFQHFGHLRGTVPMITGSTGTASIPPSRDGWHMPEANQFTWTHKELATLLIKAAGIHEGRWFLMMDFGMSAGNFGPSDDQVSPGAITAVTRVGIQREPLEQKAPSSLVVDAAEVNPASKPEGSPSRRKR